MIRGIILGAAIAATLDIALFILFVALEDGERPHPPLPAAGA
jgi:hypothetical protein